MAGGVQGHKPDYVLLWVTGLILVLGLFTMASASLILANDRFGEAYYFLNRQMVGVAIGILTLLISWKIKYLFWRKFAPVALVGSLILMILVLIPGFGLELKGARRWLDLGFTTLQPGELMKLAFVIYLAAWMDAKRKNISSFKFGFLPFICMVGAVSLLFILQPDIGTLGVLAFTSLIIFFIGGGRLAQIGLLVVLGLATLGVLIYLQPYRLDRLAVFLDPKTDPQGIGYQLNQSLIALGSGGFFGRGFGMSRQKFNYVPEAAGDSIFAIYGEEFGFIGSVGLVGLFIIFFWRGMRIALRAPDSFGRILAAGITLLIIIQAFTNIAAISGLVPLTGIPLTFISYGSSALIMNLAAVGILMNISKYIR